MTTLVTGSAGHLGEALMRTLRSQGRPALGLDVNPSPYTDLVGSICDHAFVRQCMDGIRTIAHTATLHKPHMATHAKQDFVDTNISGTLTLLEAAVVARVESFVFTSTTSAFGSALSPAPDEPAAWITEDVAPVPRNIYGVTKLAAETLCELFHQNHRFPVVILRTSRFFPEADDAADIRSKYETANVQANELLYRRADIQDVVDAHILAIDNAPRIGFGRYIVSATTPFGHADLASLRQSAPEVVGRLFPEYEPLYAARNWRFFPAIDRVYVNRRAITELGWKPQYDFAHVLECLRSGVSFQSPLAGEVGSKGYHATAFEDGPYPVFAP